MNIKELKTNAKAAIKDLSVQKENINKYEMKIAENAEQLVLITDQIEQAEEDRLEVVRQVARGEAAQPDLDKARDTIRSLSDKRADLSDLSEAIKGEIESTRKQIETLRQGIISSRSRYFKKRFEDYLEKNGNILHEAYALFQCSMKGEMRAPAPTLFISNMETMQPALFRDSAIQATVKKLSEELS